jgi:hypothetical protein
MRTIARVCFVIVLGIGSIPGCSKNTAPDVPAANAVSAQTKTAAPAPQLDPTMQPIANAAADFLDAMLKGDTQRCSTRLTPQAMQRIVASGKPFNPPGMETDSFRLGQVQLPSQDQAIVQCFYISSSKGVSHEEEACFVMRRIENDWRVAALAYGVSPDQPWTLMDFESGQTGSIPREAMAPQNAGMAGNAAGSAQQTPRTAQEPQPTTQR